LARMGRFHCSNGRCGATTRRGTWTDADRLPPMWPGAQDVGRLDGRTDGWADGRRPGRSLRQLSMRFGERSFSPPFPPSIAAFPKSNSNAQGVQSGWADGAHTQYSRRAIGRQPTRSHSRPARTVAGTKTGIAEN